jgi:hypothetical protein
MGRQFFAGENGHLKYEGYFSDDRYDGQGKLYFEDLSYYEGALKGGLFHGHG